MIGKSGLHYESISKKCMLVIDFSVIVLTLTISHQTMNMAMVEILKMLLMKAIQNQKLVLQL